MSSDTFGRNVRPLFMRTYGRTKAVRKVDTWLSPDYRKNAFSSTDVSDPSIAEANDSSVKLKKRKNKGSAKTTRAAKKKAMSNLKESDSDEENVFPTDAVPKTTVTRLRNPPRVPMRKGAERKRLSSMSENELPMAVTRRQKKATRLLSTSESEEDSLMKNPMVTSVLPRQQRSELENSAYPGTRGKFVTSRRRVRSVKLKGPSSKPPLQVLRSSLTLNSSDDFVGAAPALPRAVTHRKRLPRVPLRGGRARALLREESASLNASSDDPSLSSHAPLFSSTPSVLSRRPPSRRQDPSVSGIHFNPEDSATDVELPQPQQRGPPVHVRALPHRRLRETMALQPRPGVSLETTGGADGGGSNITEQKHTAAHSRTDIHLAPEEEEVVVVSSLAEPSSPQKQPSQLEKEEEEPSSRAEGIGQTEELTPEEHQLSLELFSQVDGEDGVQGGESVSQEASGFVTAETRLSSLVEMLKERCRTVSPMVMLPRAYLSPTLDTSSMIHSMGETFSSCLDRSPADDRCAGGRAGGRPGPVIVLSSSELSSLCSEVPPTPAAIPSPDKAEMMVEHGEEKEGAAAGREVGDVGDVEEEERSSGEGHEAAAIEVLVQRLKARCVSSQPVVLLDSVRLSPFLLRHHGIASLVPAPEGSGSDSSGAVPPNATPSSSSSDVEPHSKAHAPPKRCPKRRLSVTFPKVSADEASSPERTLLAGQCKQLAGRAGTGRKACVSGLSANRWSKRDVAQWERNQGSQTSARSRHAHDSLDLGRAAVAKHGKEPMSSWLALPITPVRAEQLNISSILAGLSPDASLSTHMWSRLKAALSVHKKKTAFITPRRLALTGIQSPALQRLNASQDIFASPSCTTLSRVVQRSPSSSLLSVEDISDAEKVYQECQQEGPLTFDECIPPPRMKLCRKIGEGTFGEVFSTTNPDGQPVALKIIPVEGKQKVNEEDQKTFGEILHEMIISKELSSLDQKENNRTNGFISLNNLHCVQGTYPLQLLNAWDKFDKQRGSENDRPDFFGEEQFFLVLEFEFGGSDLENMNGKLSSLAQAKSILQQVTAALAVAERALCFEHRDLHWGNILVKTTKQKECSYLLNGQTHSIVTRGVQVNIIDYSLSRMEIDGLTVSCDISADEELFMGQGDYQFDIYRKMREENSNEWSEYHPHTNVLWLHYLTDKLLGMKYKSSAQGAQARALKSSLCAFHGDLLAFQSATDVLQHSSLFH
ncbi:uncharacterized protein haspin isoform X2 [Clupea harengus]|uniref:Serine/threonine-protein kinase haspin n=1 Tax=Clupea harengus TaxID=7950 RepID=A0A6P8EWJ0_CLUHA|nr:uncharacterized protein haspin isoform X2 [Clupea harengus]